jgi:hypothetical protein
MCGRVGDNLPSRFLFNVSGGDGIRSPRSLDEASGKFGVTRNFDRNSSGARSLQRFLNLSYQQITINDAETLIS